MNNFLSPLPSLTSTSSTKIILVRHGRSTYNEQGRYQGCSNESVLTEKGEKAAYHTGLALQHFQFNAVYSSPLTRVQQTTQGIISGLSHFHRDLPKINLDDRLKEIHMSAWEGLSYQHVRANFPQEYACWKQTPEMFSFPLINNPFYPLKELYQRAKSLLTEILTKHCGQTVLIVAHGGTNRALISIALGLSPHKYHSLQQSNCGISCLEFPANSNLQGQLKWLNFTRHLGEKLPKLKEGKTGWRWLLVPNQIQKEQSLQEYLEPDSIDLIISDQHQKSEQLAQIWQKQLSKAVHFSVAQQNFLDLWHNNLISKQQQVKNQLSSNLITGLIFVEEALLKSTLSKLIPIKLNLKTSNIFSVIHYPHKNHHPILQGLLPTEKLIDFAYSTGKCK